MGGLFKSLLLKQCIIANTFSICFLSLQLTHAQQANVWYMGNGAGLDFNTSPPTTLEDGNAGLLGATGEGVGAVADINGNLLFYTNGSTIYDATHTAMSNGTGLNGNGTTTQTGTISLDPGDPTRYFVFTPRDANGQVTYSVVDIDLNGGLGDVVPGLKNIVLLANGSEGCLVVPHQNGTDYWVIFHASTTNVYHVFSLTSGGISGPTNYAVGNSGQATLRMNVNNCFDKIATALYNFRMVDVVNFDNNTGVISGPVLTLNNFNSDEVYGVEFSPNDDYIYVSESGLNNRDDIHQFDLTAGGPAAINASRYTYLNGGTTRSGALRLGPDGKIYVPAYTTTTPGFLSVIENPNVKCPGCNFSYQAINFPSKRVGEGLPPVIKSFVKGLNIFADNTCEGGSTQLTFTSATVPGSNPGDIRWEFGDGEPDSLDSDTVTHVYATAGIYTVTLTIIDICGITVTATKDITIKAGPQVSVSCSGGSTVDFTGTGPNAANYVWSFSPSMTPVEATGSTFSTSGSGTVYVEDPTPLASHQAGNTDASQTFGSDDPTTFFELYSTTTLTSFQLKSRVSSGSGTVWLENDVGGTVWGTAPINPTASGQVFTFTPNVSLSPGKYTLFISDKNLVFRNNTSADGGRDVAGLIDVIGMNDPPSATRGGPFYNLELEIPDPCGIRSFAYDCTLPVELLSFDANKRGNTSALTWVTASEENNSHFEVETSLDGIVFESIGLVEGAGNSAQQQHYSFAHESPKTGLNYYRLKQVDYDGSFSYSTVKSLDFNPSGILVYPNPAESSITISNSTKSAAYSLYSVHGKLLASGTMLNGSTTLDVSQFPEAIYVLNVTDASGHIEITKLTVAH